MIIKKPYAFLIKNFKLIHLIISLLVAYIIYKTHSIFIFFNNYANTGYYTFKENLSSIYINFYLFISVILLILLSLAIYLLMKWKNKSRTFYIAFIIFYFILFISFLVYFNALSNLTIKTLEIRIVRAYRDIILLLYLPQYIFLSITLVRAIGFDIKKFDFKKDLEELDIKEEDQEEIELTLGNNTYKIKRSIRRVLRELRYYIIENKFFFISILSIALLIIITIIYLNITVYNKKYNETDLLEVDGIIYNVESSYTTDTDYTGNKFTNNDRYFIVKVKMTNNTNKRITLDSEKISLVLDNKEYYPTYSMNNFFIDLGESYTKNLTLYSMEENTYLVIFKIPSNLTYNTSTFRLTKGIKVIKGEISSNHKDVVLNAKELFYDDTTTLVNKSDTIDLTNTTLDKTTFKVISNELSNTFTENINYCINEKCYEGIKQITPDIYGKGKRTILKLNTEVSINKELNIYKYVKTSEDFIKYFGKITYNYEGTTYTINANVKELNLNNSNNVYLEVPYELYNSTSIKLDITIRNKKYTINL